MMDYTDLIEVEALPAHKQRLIDGGITREEYCRRFGLVSLDDASRKAFSRYDTNKAMAEQANHPSPRNPYLDPHGRLIGEALMGLIRSFPQGVTVERLTQQSGLCEKQVFNKIAVLRKHGKIRTVGKAHSSLGRPMQLWQAVPARGDA